MTKGGHFTKCLGSLWSHYGGGGVSVGGTRTNGVNLKKGGLWTKLWWKLKLLIMFEIKGFGFKCKLK